GSLPCGKLDSGMILTCGRVLRGERLSLHGSLLDLCDWPLLLAESKDQDRCRRMRTFSPCSPLLIVFAKRAAGQNLIFTAKSVSCVRASRKIALGRSRG